MILIDKLCYSSNYRYKNACLKTGFSLITLVICVASRSFVVSIITLLSMGYLSIFGGGVAPKLYFRFMKLPIAFVLLSTVAIIINFSDQPLSAFAIPLFGKYLTASKDSLLFAGRLILTALAAVSCLYFLSLTTPITDILMVLKKMRCPYLLIELMLLIYRFIFVLLDIATSLSTAQKARLGNKDFMTSCHSVGNIMAVLLVRAFQKSSLLYDAMESRCYDGVIQVLEEDTKVEKKDFIGVILFDSILVIISVWLHFGY